MMTYQIQYQNDAYPTIQNSGTYEQTVEVAKKRNKYNETFTITEAPKKDWTIEKEKALEDLLKYGD